MAGKWTKEKAWEWYESLPWLRGCNFMGSDCCNRVDQWQEYGFEEKLATADRELELAASIGFNSIRIIMQYEVWRDQHDGYMERLDRYLQTAYKYGITSMVCFGNDCTVPREDYLKRMRLGPQTVDLGYHGGLKRSPHDVGVTGWSILDDPENFEKFCTMIAEIMTKYANDPRIVVWDLFNEAGNNKRSTLTFPHLKKFFEIAREIDPSQPLTSCIFGDPNLRELIIENSDVITYHNYRSYNDNIKVIDYLRGFERPFLNTEWLNRITHNTVDIMFPLFWLENIGCYNWGFVAGKYQTYEPWGSLWSRYDKGEASDLDFTKWQHDLFRPNFRPYDPKEIEIIKLYCKMADEKYNKK